MKILSLPVDNGGCGNYRIRQPFKGLAKLLPVRPHIIDTKESSFDEIAKLIQLADIVFMRPGSEVGMRKIKQIPEFKNMNAKWVIDIDDDVDNISPLSDFYRSYGQKEYVHNNKKVWVDGKNGFDLKNNKARKKSLDLVLRESDAVIVSTKVLAEKARQYNKNVIINYNSINFNQYPSLTKKPNTPLRIVWHGSPSHFEDFLPIRNGINEILRKNKVEMYMIGSNYMSLWDDDVKHKVKTYPFVPFAAHSYRMLCFQADIAIIPLEDNEFNRSKSSIKWHEMSACGIPSVVSNVTPYKEDVVDQETAYAYNNEKEFVQKLQYLIDYPFERRKISRNAYRWVYKNRNLVKQSKKFYEQLQCLIS
jgi:glycosyltransferase involved in cell wall biosynthesis